MWKWKCMSCINQPVLLSLVKMLKNNIFFRKQPNGTVLTYCLSRMYQYISPDPQQHTLTRWAHRGGKWQSPEWPEGGSSWNGCYASPYVQRWVGAGDRGSHRPRICAHWHTAAMSQCPPCDGHVTVMRHTLTLTVRLKSTKYSYTVQKKWEEVEKTTMVKNKTVNRNSYYIIVNV